MMGLRGLTFFLILCITFLNEGCKGQAIVCNNNGFYCVTSTSFALCAFNNNTNRFEVVDINSVNSCPASSFCSNLDQVECSSTTAVTTTPATPAPTTTQSTVSTTAQPTTTISTLTTVPPICNTTGLFPDPSVPNCKGYILCYGINNVVLQLKLTCQGLSSFDPILGACSDAYQCSNITSCTSIGRVVNPIDCTSYYLCVRNRFGGFSRQRYRCPGKTLFSSRSKCCSRNTQCFLPITSIPPVTPPPVVCPSTTALVSYVRDPLSADCRSFYMCTRVGAGFRITRRDCLPRWAFSRQLRRCVPSIFSRCP